MARLHRTYKQEVFPEPLRDLTLRLIKMKPWRKEADPEHLFKVWVHGACLFYQLPTPQMVKIDDHVSRRSPTYGEYKKAEASESNPFGVIVLRRWSVLSLMHQFRHHMQANRDELTQDPYDSDAEAGEDAQAWACSLFYAVAPRRFRRMVRAGRVIGVHPEDLLKRKKS